MHPDLYREGHRFDSDILHNTGSVQVSSVVQMHPDLYRENYRFDLNILHRRPIGSRQLETVLKLFLMSTKGPEIHDLNISSSMFILPTASCTLK
jgi:hypothetical protein